MKKSKYLFLLIFMLIVSFSFNTLANYKGNENDKGKKPMLQKPGANPSMSLLNINGASCWVTEEGFHDWVVASGWNGAFPIGTTVGAIFAEGIVWGGKVNDGSTPLVRVNGNTYGTGCAPVTRLYRVRPDYADATADLTMDAATFNNVSIDAVSATMIADLKTQYAKDWNEWPVNEGAPYKDVDGNGSYDPNVDIPGIPGASQTLFIKYNDDLSESNYGSPPIGMEISETYWGYAVSGALNNVIFKKVDMVYKGTPTSANNSTIDSMYIVQWADPDVGSSGDDFAGCDTTLDLGYAYSSKSTDATYDGISLPPPAVGYDFLQGVSTYTGNPNDSAMFNLQWRKGYKYINRKPMSSYAYFAAGGTWSDPDFEYNGTLEFYNLMRGYLPIPRYPSGDPFPETVADVTGEGTFLLTGDPVFGNGKIDGGVDGPGDRRIMVTNGPISMNLNDTAQVVVALVYGLGKNNLASISTLKFYDAFAQYAYDQLFDIPIMPTPDISAAELDNQITISWSSDETIKNSIENSPHGPYDFQGYAVYQLPYGSTDVTQGVRVATFDVADNVSVIADKVLDENTGLIYTKPIVFLNNASVIQRFLSLDKDYINNKALINGQSYTFAVTAFGYNNDPGLPTFILESKPAIVNVTPQMTEPGTRLETSYGDTLDVSRVSGASDGNVVPIVIDPTKLTGLTYTVSFDTISGGTVVWNVDRSDGVRVLSNQTNQKADNESPIVDGIQFRVVGAPLDFTNFMEIANANGPHDPTYATFSFNSSGFPHGDFTEDRPSPNAGGVRWGIQTGPNGAFSYDNFKTRVARNDNWSRIVPYDFEIRFTAAGGKGDEFVNGEGFMDVPFELWNIGIGTPDDPSDDFRMIPLLYDYDANNNFGISSADHTISGGDNDPATDWIYWYNPVDMTPGSAGYDDFANNLNENAIGDEVLARFVFVNFNGGSVTDPTYPANLVQQVPETGTIFRILTTKPNQPGSDVFSFVAPKPTFSSETAKADIEMINVFPNPYYGYHYRETSPTNHYVTFSHLPDNAVIRVFDISGVLVKTINHTPDQGQFNTWDLQNDNNYPVASGIYIVHVDMPDLGKTKILKLAVIQEQQMLKVY